VGVLGKRGGLSNSGCAWVRVATVRVREALSWGRKKELGPRGKGKRKSDEKNQPKQRDEHGHCLRRTKKTLLEEEKPYPKKITGKTSKRSKKLNSFSGRKERHFTVRKGHT